MRWHEISEGVGRIVKGVNTTPDVGVDQTSIEAKKFGNSVDKDGKPLYTMHKKAHKNTKPNTLFNMGMTESQIKELKSKELSAVSEIYVDMDGVLADFFPAWRKIVGKDWRQITDIESALQTIRDKDDFWLSLPLTKNAQNLLNIIKELKGEYKILSAPLANDPKAEPHKREWIKKNLAFFPPKEVIISADKYKWAKQPDGTPNILIDDFGSNIRNWEAKGGVGFKHKDHKFERTAGLLKDYFTKPAERETEETNERMPATVIQSKQRYAKMTDKELANRFKDSDEQTLRQMAWRHGYGKMSSHYWDRVQKGKAQTEETNESEMRMDKSAFVKILADKIKEPQKGHGRPEYDNRLLAKIYKLITGQEVDFEGDKFTINVRKPQTETAVDEGELDKDEEAEKERIVKGMKKNKSDFKKRYGKDAEAVMYATATKMAKSG